MMTLFRAKMGAVFDTANLLLYGLPIIIENVVRYYDVLEFLGVSDSLPVN